MEIPYDKEIATVITEASTEVAPLTPQNHGIKSIRLFFAANLIHGNL